MVELPRFPEKEIGALWVLRTKERAIELVITDVQPSHPDWPGRVMGWPVPSLEYRRERWELYRKSAENSVNNYRSLLSDLESDSQQTLGEAWDFYKKHTKAEVSAFAGPEDPAFASYLKNRYVEGLKRSKLNLDRLLKAKP